MHLADAGGSSLKICVANPSGDTLLGLADWKTLIEEKSTSDWVAGQICAECSSPVRGRLGRDLRRFGGLVNLELTPPEKGSPCL